MGFKPSFQLDSLAPSSVSPREPHGEEDPSVPTRDLRDTGLQLSWGTGPRWGDLLHPPVKARQPGNQGWT